MWRGLASDHVCSDSEAFYGYLPWECCQHASGPCNHSHGAFTVVSDALRVHPEFWGLLLRQVDHVDVSLY